MCGGRVELELETRGGRVELELQIRGGRIELELEICGGMTELVVMHVVKLFCGGVYLVMDNVLSHFTTISSL